MKRIITALLGLGSLGMAYSQTLTVTDHETGKPLEYVTLISQTPKAAATTGAGGQCDISSFHGSERIQIRSLGYDVIYCSYSDLESAGLRIALSPSNHLLEEVVVSATRWRQSTSNISSKIISIPSEAIALQNPQTAADLLGISGRVFLQKSQQGGGSPMIRGFATNRLLYTVDGVRMNTAIFRAGNIQNVINLDPFATEETEVLFGPGSVIYGSDAIGGVMSFQTLSPHLSHTGEVTVSGQAAARYASANKERTGHFHVNVGWDKWALVTSFSSWDFDDLKQGSHGPDDYIKDYYVQRQDGVDRVITQRDSLLQIPSAYSQMNLMQKLRFKPNENWDLQYGFHYSEISPYGRYDRHNRVRNGTARYAEWEYGPQKWMMNNLSIHHRGKHTLYDQMTLRLAQQSFEESRISRDLNNPVREVRVEKVGAWSANLDLTREAGHKNTLFYGVEFVMDDVVSEGTDENIDSGILIDGPDRYPQSDWYSVAAYLEDEFRMNELLTLQAGLRYNQFILHSDFSGNTDFYPFPFTTADIGNGALTGTLGGVFHPGNSWAVRANLGTAFRSPNVDDIGKVFDSEPGSVVVPNPDLEAEYAWNLDLGIAKAFDNLVKLDLTGYYTILQNAMVRRDYTLNGRDSILYDGTMSKVQAIQNAAVAYVYGLQAGVDVTLPSGFGLNSDLNFQRGTEELDDGTTSPSRHAAPLFGTTALSYRNNRLILRFYTYYQAEKSHDELPAEEQGKDEIYAHDGDGNTYAPAWYTLNADAMVKLNDLFSVSAGVENLTDMRYRPYSSGISGPGRNFKLSIRVEF
jgi:hemoglobin/transferrin/lactoferrin receptor protein